MSSLTITGLIFTTSLILIALFAHYGRRLHESKNEERSHSDTANKKET
ncbi:MAG: hypothetical protein PHX13_10355 [Thiovulaceae bacterium]|nr:hypothetical protein [Sulfurimonadaceae bacterium]